MASRAGPDTVVNSLPCEIKKDFTWQAGQAPDTVVNSLQGRRINRIRRIVVIPDTVVPPYGAGGFSGFFVIPDTVVPPYGAGELRELNEFIIIFFSGN